jgi:hypothetical protein
VCGVVGYGVSVIAGMQTSSAADRASRTRI